MTLKGLLSSTVAFGAVVGLPFLVNAANLIIKNDLRDSLVVTIQGGAGTVVTKSDHELTHTLQAGEEKRLHLSPVELGNESTFSVTGRSGISFSTQGPIPADKDVKVIYLRNKMGMVTSVIEEIKS